MPLPKKIYRLHLLPTKGKPLSYRQKGGGTFASLSDMQYRIEQMEREGREYEIYESELDWVKIGGSEPRFDPLRTDTLPFDT